MTDTAIRNAVAALIERRDLPEDAAAACMVEIAEGAATPAQTAAWLLALRMKGETAEEMTGLLRVMRERAARVDAGAPLLDTCGTGGDASSSFNVSTCAALIAAGAGARVAKHGNRAVTSQCGSADVLEALGAKIELTPAQVAACIERAGMGFMFAPLFHPAMKHVGPVRREIGVRTVFNLVAPLANPAGARRQVVGVPSADLVETVAAVLQRTGSEHALVVHGDDGFDELSISGASSVAEVTAAGVRTHRVSPEDVGLGRHDIGAVRGGTPQENATALQSLLEGTPGPLRDFALLNAAAALVAWGAAPDLRAGVQVARESVDSGAALAKLDAFVAATREA
jgi:anthranilate phosphoribosyltransferase